MVGGNWEPPVERPPGVLEEGVPRWGFNRWLEVSAIVCLFIREYMMRLYVHCGLFICAHACELECHSMAHGSCFSPPTHVGPSDPTRLSGLAACTSPNGTVSPEEAGVQGQPAQRVPVADTPGGQQGLEEVLAEKMIFLGLGVRLWVGGLILDHGGSLDKRGILG